MGFEVKQDKSTPDDWQTPLPAEKDANRHRTLKKHQPWQNPQIEEKRMNMKLKGLSVMTFPSGPVFWVMCGPPDVRGRTRFSPVDGTKPNTVNASHWSELKWCRASLLVFFHRHPTRDERGYCLLQACQTPPACTSLCIPIVATDMSHSKHIDILPRMDGLDLSLLNSATPERLRFVAFRNFA